MGHDHKAPEPSHWKAKDQQVSQYGERRRGLPYHQGRMNGASNGFHPSAAHSPNKTKTKTLPRYAPHPTHLPATVWKSEGVKERDKFDRTLKKVSYFAPRFVKCGLFPRNQDEWRDLRFDYIRDQLAARDHDKKVLAARIEAMSSIPPLGRNIKSIFGPEGKEMRFAGSSVLGWPTIWSKYQHCHAAQSVWPTIAELLTHGDNRGDFGRSYRSFPPPRQYKNATQSFEDLRFICASPLDEIEPEFTYGPTYAEYTKRNAEDDNDESFQVELEKWLDNALKEAIGGEVARRSDVVRRERNGEKKCKILSMDDNKHEKDREGKDQQSKCEKQHGQAPSKAHSRRRRIRYHHPPKVHPFNPMKSQLAPPGMMMTTRGMSGVCPPIAPAAYTNKPAPYPYPYPYPYPNPYPGPQYGPGNIHRHGHGQILYAAPVVAGTQAEPVLLPPPLMYGGQRMPNGSYGYPQADGSWEFRAHPYYAPPGVEPVAAAGMHGMARTADALSEWRCDDAMIL